MTVVAGSGTGTAPDALRARFDTGVTRSYRWRRAQLRGLRRMLREHRDQWHAALRTDLGKHPVESDVAEIGIVLREIDHALRRLRRWMRPRRVGVPLVLAPATARIVPEPLGVVLVIGPWNYPLQLVLNPLVGALAAGNAAVLKPSELAGATSAALAALLPRYVDPRAVRVVEGGAEATQRLLHERFDHVFFTGSETVGRIIAQEAARTLTPVTLELGGKSPVFIDDTVDLAVTARRLMWGKLLNAGQTCVAPDYVLATPSTAQALIPHLERAVREMYGDDPARSPDYGRIVTPRHAERLAELLDGHRPSFGGTVSPADRYVAPTVVDAAEPHSRLMQEEIFGPILPIVHVASAGEARAFIRARPAPLAAYVFTRRRAVRRAFLRETTSGALGFGAPAAHLGAPELPFGGVGASGHGRYHGRHSFDTFSHARAVLRKPLHPDTMALAYPPYRGWAKALLVRVMTGMGRSAP
ncbi:MAG: aldehyde dehydrogenase family protein [Actinobacteria bacterium]|nr:aldehyde dehydrogenase family protein [Actinomycetota bacterium]